MKRFWILFTLSAAVAAFGWQATTASAGEVALTSGDKTTNWTTTGSVEVDKSKAHTEGGESLKVGPGGMAVLKVADAPVAGKVTLWVYEDMGSPEKPKERGAGALWGLAGPDNEAVAVGAIYAPYLSGDASYATGDWKLNDKSTHPSHKVQYLGLKRAEGWHKWTFDMDPEKGLTMTADGKPVKRFDWNKTGLKGFNQVVLIGDQTKDARQTLWVGDVTYEAAGDMKAAPTPPPPPPPVVPEKDEAAANPVPLVPAVAGKHPRLLFTAEDIPAMKKFIAEDPEGQFAWKQIEAYLSVCKAPAEAKFLNDATDGQRQGLWRMPTVALHYVLTGDKKSFDNTVGYMKMLLDLPHWESGKERDSGMSAANIMIGAALAYDWLYNDLDPAFREAYAKKLLLQARAMYYGGHLNGNKAVGYWQGDPQNNHRWHRDAGFSLCALAVAGDVPDTDFIISKLAEEMAFVNEWLPADGTSHESPSYMVFGMAHLTLACDATDRCLGTKYLEGPYFKTNPMFRMATLAPGLKDVFGYGDFGGTGGYNNFLWRLTGANKSADLQAGCIDFRKATSRDEAPYNSAFMYGWFTPVWFNPSVTGGSVENLPKNAYFDDLGILICRDSWLDPNGVGMMFKCGPLGGYELNKYRNENGMHYINVAHDDPDANTFNLYCRGEMVAQDGGYAGKKLSSSQNTILVNGKGQIGEGGGWSQPLKGKYADMTRMAYLTALKDTPAMALVEGEAANCYPDLNRYRRTMIWAPNGYVLILDDIRAGQAVDVAWLVQSPKVDIVDEAARLYRLTSGETTCDLKSVCDQPAKAVVVDSTADSHGKDKGWKQLQIQVKAQACRIATVFDAWGKKEFNVELKAQDADTATVVVTAGGDVVDTWTWKAAPDSATAATLTCTRKDGSKFEVTAADKAPLPIDLTAAAPAAAEEKPAKAARAPRKAAAKKDAGEAQPAE